MKKYLVVILILVVVIVISAGSVSAGGQANDTDDVDLKIDVEREKIDYIEPDTPVTYRITVENAKSVAYNTSVRINSYNLEHLSYYCDIGSYSVKDNSNNTWDSARSVWEIGNLSANENATLLLNVKPTLYDDVAYIDFGVLTYSNELNWSDNYEDDDFFINPPSADLKVSFESDIADPFPSRTPIVFNVTVENRRFLAEKVVLVIHTSYFTVTDYKLSTGDIDVGDIDEDGDIMTTWDIGDLDTNQTATLKLFVKAKKGVDKAYIYISAYTHSHDSNRSNNEFFTFFDVYDPSADLDIEFPKHNVKIDHNGNFNFKVYVTNNDGIANDVKVRIKYPSWVGDINFYPSKGSFNKKTRIWDIGTLYEKETASMNIVGKSDEDFRIVFFAATSSNELDGYNNFLGLGVEKIKYYHPVAKHGDRRTSEQRSFYSTSQYSDYRELTNASKTKPAENPDGNSIIGDVNPIIIGAVLILLILINKRRIRIDF